MTIDWWTLGFQTVNVAVLIWLLGHFFWTPVAAIIAARTAAAASVTEQAAAAQAKATAALADVEKTRDGFAEERGAILAAAHAESATARDAMLAAAHGDADALHTAATSAIADERTAAAAQWADSSSDLAVLIAGRLAARLDGAVVEQCFLDWLTAEIATLSPAIRDAETLDATTAVALDPAAQKRVAASIDAAFGRSVTLRFKTDAALIAGIEVRGEHLTVASSWRADLAAIRADLSVKPAA